MQKARIRRRVAALLLGMSILAPTAWGDERTARDVREAKTGPVGLLLDLWGQLTALWQEEGSHIDPYGDGATSSSPTPPSAEENEAGAYIDPFG